MPASTDSASDLDDISFLGRLSEALSQRIEEQTRELFDDAGIVIPVRSCSLLTALRQAGEASAAELARALGQSHQLVVQKCPALLRLGLVTQHADPADARRKLFRLTDKGAAQMALLDSYTAGISAVYERLFEETGDAHAILLKTLRALQDRPLRERARD
ncbi:MAG: MarR family winged helix-turn-helix transcriptional regulator [Sphingopyxis sp.]|uniref:MarR family winged helix-turn-helix transcriptional regulator n=1 Tax=Sphingopyxis sp. TaxID=1908224 RepID=UPI003D6C72D6